MKNNCPDYYISGDVQVRDFIKGYGFDFCLGNVIKYISRAGKKPSNEYHDDLEKALNYLKYEINYEDDGVRTALFSNYEPKLKLKDFLEAFNFNLQLENVIFLVTMSCYVKDNSCYKACLRLAKTFLEAEQSKEGKENAKSI